MKILNNIIFIILLSIISVKAQNNNLVKYSPDFVFNEGVYFTYESFKQNKPYSKSLIVTNIPLNDIDFFNKITENEKIVVFDETGTKQEINTNQLWGYCNNNIIYINYEGKFYRMPIIGEISQFIANIKIIRTSPDPFYSRGYYPNMGTTTYEDSEIRQFLLNFSNGNIYFNNYKNVEILISSNKVIYDEYMALPKRKRKQLSYMYIKKFNDANPIYFPKN